MGGTWARQLKAQWKSLSSLGREDLDCALLFWEGKNGLYVYKNVMLHLDERRRCDVLRMFHGALRKDGLLVMGHTQEVPEALRPLLEQVAPHAQVYRKLDVPAAHMRRLDCGAADRVGPPEGRPCRTTTPTTVSCRAADAVACIPTDWRFRRAWPGGAPNFLP
jgi:hypothetical protein